MWYFFGITLKKNELYLMTDVIPFYRQKETFIEILDTFHVLVKYLKKQAKRRNKIALGNIL
jgi:hypothetical protein